MGRPKALFLIRGNHMLLPNNARMELQELLIDGAGLDVIVDEDWAELTPERLATYDLIASAAGGMLFRYRGGASVREANDREIGALLDAIEGGKPFIGLHCSALMFMDMYYYRQPLGHLLEKPDPADMLQSFQVRYLEMLGNAVLTWPDRPRPNSLLSPTQLRYLDMIGLNFITDEGLEPTRISIVDRNHPITAGVADFEIRDELYHCVGDRSKLHVLAEAKGWPLIWNHQWGKGKVHYNALGHDREAVANPNFQKLVIQAVAWALSGDEQGAAKASQSSTAVPGSRK